MPGMFGEICSTVFQESFGAKMTLLKATAKLINGHQKVFVKGWLWRCHVRKWRGEQSSSWQSVMTKWRRSARGGMLFMLLCWCHPSAAHFLSSHCLSWCCFQGISATILLTLHLAWHKGFGLSASTLHCELGDHPLVNQLVQLNPSLPTRWLWHQGSPWHCLPAALL